MPTPADDREIVKLKHPVQHGEDTITELAFRRGHAGDFRGLTLGDNIAGNDLLKLAGRLCGQPSSVIEKLEDEDSGEALGRALGFFARGLTTGADRSES